MGGPGIAEAAGHGFEAKQALPVRFDRGRVVQHQQDGLGADGIAGEQLPALDVQGVTGTLLFP